MTAGPTAIFPILLILLLIGAAVQDGRTYAISNRWPLAIILLFLPYAWFSGLGLGVGWHLAHFALVLGIGMVLFAFRWFGGGDVKLYAALSLWFALGDGPRLIMAVALAGFVEVVIYFIIGRVSTSGEKAPAIVGRRIPYGLAIAAGGVLSIATTPSFWS